MTLLSNGIFVSNQDFVLVLSHQTPARVILTIPHGGLIGNDLRGILPSRTSGIKGGDGFVWPVAKDIVINSQRLGILVNAVRLLMPREMIDGNRALPGSTILDPDTKHQTALEDLSLASVYQHYHGQINTLIEQAIRQFGPENVLLIDLHGFGKQPDFAPEGGFDLILGTANRATVPHGDIDEKLALFMKAREYKIFLPGTKPVKPEGDPYNAGHTTRYYARIHRINVIQIETARKYRNKESQTLGEQLARDIALFFRQHFG